MRAVAEAVRWQERGLCRGMDPDLFFPERGPFAADLAAKARSVCRNCPVREDCLEFALANNEKYGVWGGLTGKERQKARRHRVQLRAVGL